MSSQFPFVTGAQMMIVAAQGSEPEITPPIPWDLVPMPYLVGALVLLVLIAMITGAVRRSLPGNRRRPLLPLRWRAALRIHPGPGWVGGWERWRVLGLPRARKVAKAARPSLSWWDRYRPGGWREYATRIGTAWGWVFRRRVVATGEDVVLVFGGPRRGKSQASADSLIDAPGRVIATSVRGDVLDTTVGPRSTKGTIYIWNPEGVGDKYGSSLRWNPVAGCEDPRVAARRAGYMVEAQTSRGLSDADFWNDQTSMILAGYLHAAALVGYSMTEVYAWSQGREDTPLRILRQAQGANVANRDDVAHFQEHMPERTQGSIVTTLRRCLQFLRSPDIASMLSPHPDPAVETSLPRWFDVEEFLTAPGDQATLYLIASGEDNITGPLFSALVAEIAYTVRYTSARMPGGRLDPPLDFEGDEIANVAPIPVHRWASWMGGCGIRMRIYAQSWAQLRERFDQMANSLWACASMIIVYGGAVEDELLDKVRKLAGGVQVRGRDQVRWSQDRDGNRVKEKTPTYEQMEVLTSADMRLPRHCAVVFSTDVPPVLVRTPQARLRSDVRHWKDRLPEGVVSPARRELPQVDYGLRQDLETEQQVWVPRRMPLHVVKGIGTDATEEKQEPQEQEGAGRGAAPTQPMPSMRVPEPVREQQRPQAPPPVMPEGRRRGDVWSPNPPNGSTPAPSPTASGNLHPAPWELRSEPVRPEPEPVSETAEDDDLRGARLPWDDE